MNINKLKKSELISHIQELENRIGKMDAHISDIESDNMNLIEELSQMEDMLETPETTPLKKDKMKDKDEDVSNLLAHAIYNLLSTSKNDLMSVLGSSRPLYSMTDGMAIPVSTNESDLIRSAASIIKPIFERMVGNIFGMLPLCLCEHPVSAHANFSEFCVSCNCREFTKKLSSSKNYDIAIDNNAFKCSLCSMTHFSMLKYADMSVIVKLLKLKNILNKKIILKENEDKNICIICAISTLREEVSNSERTNN